MIQIKRPEREYVIVSSLSLFTKKKKNDYGVGRKHLFEGGV